LVVNCNARVNVVDFPSIVVVVVVTLIVVVVVIPLVDAQKLSANV